jgi:trehalose 6-phosphate phosphatase
VPGVLFERKRFSLAVHHRMVADPDDVARVERAVDAALVGTHLRRREGKRVIELLPDVEWDKGRALRWILDVQGLDTHRTFPIHIGDDETDEDAFGSDEHERLLSIRIGDAPSKAGYRLERQEDIDQLLTALLRARAGRHERRSADTRR